MELTIEQALQQGVEADKEGKVQEAERLYRAILQAQPQHPDANHNLGVLAVSVNKTEEALPLLKTALEADSKKEQFWFSYIDALIKEKQFKNAKQVIEQAKTQGVAEGKLNILETQLTPTAQVNESKLAVQNKSLSLSQKRKKLSEKNKQKKATKQNLKANNPPQKQLSNLLEYYQNGRFNDAEKLATSITQEFPKHQSAWKVLGAVFEATGRRSKAEDANQKVVALSPKDAVAHYNLGVALKELGRLDDAEASFRQAVTLKPDFPESYNNLGMILQELARLAEAEACYMQAIALKPNYTQAYNNLGVTLKKLGRLDEAEASYKQAIALEPDLAEAHNNLGNILQSQDRFGEAEASYRQAIALQSEYTEALHNLGVTLQELDRLDEAEASFKQVITLKPDFVESHYSIGVTLQEMGRLEEAEASFRHSISLKAGLAKAHSSLGTVLYAKGDIDSGLESLKKAKNFDPDLVSNNVTLTILQARKARGKTKISATNISNPGYGADQFPPPLILNRAVEAELIRSLYEVKSIKLDKFDNSRITDCRYGNGKCSRDDSLFKDCSSIIKSAAEDLSIIMKEAVGTDIYLADSFFNIYGAGGGSVPHLHINKFDKGEKLNFSKQKYSLVYYLSVGDQNCSEPGILKLYEPAEDILPSEGMIVITPAARWHSAVYGGEKDRVMIGVNFYSL